MSSSNQTTSRDNKYQDDDIARFDNWDPMADDFNSSKNTLALNPSRDPLAIITGKVQPISSKIGNITICERFATYGSCADGQYCSKIHVNPQARDKIWELQNTYESNKGRTLMNFTYLSPIEVEINPDILLLVSVTSAKAPNNFHVVAPYENLNFAPLTQQETDFYIQRVDQSSTVKAKLQRYHDQLAAFFDHNYRIDNLNDDIYLSQIVACNIKGVYSRAVIIGLPESFDDINYKLMLIDQGIEVILPREQIYDIKAQLLSDPPLAYNCRLDIKPSNDKLEWSQTAMDQFNNIVKKKKFVLCKVIKQIKGDRILTVDLIEPKNRSSLTNMLILKGSAAKCTC